MYNGPYASVGASSAVYGPALPPGVAAPQNNDFEVVSASEVDKNAADEAKDALTSSQSADVGSSEFEQTDRFKAIL